MRSHGRSLIASRGMALGVTLLLGACSSTGPVATVPAQSGRDMASLEQRLQALEDQLGQLTRRMDALQAADGAQQSRPGAVSAATDYRPIRPGIVLASHTAAAKPMSPPAPLPAVAPLSRQQPAPVLPPEPRTPPRQGNWVVNLASYTSADYATRKRKEFAGAGVAAEQVQAEVNGATIYRLRVPGFDSHSEASAEARSLGERLGIDDTWVARR